MLQKCILMITEYLQYLEADTSFEKALQEINLN
jgi:hypothetical protein